MIQSYEMQGDAAGPGDVIQCTLQVPVPPGRQATFKGLTLEDGCEAVGVFIGKSQMKVPDAVGKPVDGGSYLIALVRNTTDEVKALRAVVTLEGDGLPEPGPLGLKVPEAAPTQPAPVSQPTASVVHAQPMAAAVPPPAPAPAVPAAGANEVVVVLIRSEAQVLYEALTKQRIADVMHPSQIGGVIKRLENALR